MISPPPNQNQIQGSDGKPDGVWIAFFSEVFKSIRALQTSGTTAERPTKGLYVGRPYFDTSINRPIWYNGTAWIRSDGSIV